VRARVVAPLVAALLGITGGTLTGVLTSGDPDDPVPPAAVRDPLGLGIAMVTLECAPDHGVLVLGFGDTAPALRAAKADNPSGDPSYVDTTESCDTIYGPERRVDPPRYAVVLGPFDSLEEPCELRMDPARRGDFVTHLREGNSVTVKCVCVLGDVAGRPELRPGMSPSAADRVWIRSLQGMLNDALGDGFPREWVTGDYDDNTVAAVRTYQESSGFRSALGVVDDETWTLLKTRICKTYDF
jgi:hypothetical protein